MKSELKPGFYKVPTFNKLAGYYQSFRSNTLRNWVMIDASCFFVLDAKCSKEFLTSAYEVKAFSSKGTLCYFHVDKHLIKPL